VRRACGAKQRRGCGMKKAIIALVALAVFMSGGAFALQNSFMDMRGELFEESKKIKELLGKSKDTIALSSMWDTCLITISQIDAYFNMLALFNSVPEKYLTQESAGCLTKWMEEIRKTNDMNIKLLAETSSIVDEATKSRMQIMKDYFMRLNARIVSEIDNINAIKATLKKNTV
jgi:hypothetical protein